MNKINNLRKRTLALFLALTMCLSLVQVTAFASEDGGQADTVITDTTGENEAMQDTNVPTETEDDTDISDGDEADAADSKEEKEIDADASDEENADANSSDEEKSDTDDSEKEENSEGTSEEEASAEGTPVCSCTTKCGEDSVNTECPVCGVEDADLTACEGIDKVHAFLDAVAELETLQEQEDPDPDEFLAAMQNVLTCYDALSEEQKSLLEENRAASGEEVTYAEMIATLREGTMTTEEPPVEELTKPFKVGEATYATLAEAFNAIPENGTETIIVTAPVTVNETARCTGTRKNITITSGEGGPYTITRGEIPAVQDSARSTYNPAMVEIDGTLRLENIILDDGCKAAGTRYSQATTDGKGGNGDTVQDAIIATYDGGDEIILGSGVELRNFGGMSAVRLSGGKLTMESGSKIVGSKEFATNGGGTGAAGSVWIQGGEFIMNEGAEISNVNGRAVYIDGGSATINGTISNITGNLNMWQNESGVAIHVRNNGYAVLGETGVIDGIKGDHAGYRGAVMTNGSRGEGLWDFEAKQGSVIRNVTGFPTLYSNYGTELLNGLITDCTNDFIIGGFAQKTTIGETGVIEKCTASTGAANAIVYTSNASKVFLKGTVRDNTSSYAFYIINQSGGAASLDMYEGALISGDSGTGVYVNASGSRFDMHGGKITGYRSNGVQVNVKTNNPAYFNMEGGEISGNGTGVSYSKHWRGDAGAKGYVNIIGGTISDNTTQINISASEARDDFQRVNLAANVVKATNGKNASVYTSFGTLTLDADYANISLGNATSAASQKIKDLAAAYKLPKESEEDEEDQNTYEAIGSALWFKPATGSLNFIASRYYNIKGLSLYVAYIPLNADGTPAGGDELIVKEVTNGSMLKVQLDNLTPDQPYALMWMQPVPKYGDIKITKPTTGVSEVLGQESYPVEYGTTYTMPRDVAKLLKAGDTFKITVDLDSRLSYDENAPVGKEYSSYFELGEVVYDSVDHLLTIETRITKETTSSLSVSLTIPTTMTGTAFDVDDPAPLIVNVKINGAVVLTEDEDPTNFECEIPTPWETELTPLPYQAVSYTGGSTDVKKGTMLTVDPGVGTLTDEVPATVEENIRISDPTREGYDFIGWTVDNDTTNHTLTLTAQWTRSAHEHQWGPWQRITDPDCTMPGLERHSCTLSDCNVTQDRAIAALGHNWREAWEQNEDGHWHICDRCGATSEVIAHTYPDTWTVRTPATTTAEGEEYRDCTVCGHEVTRPIAQLPVTPVIPPVTPPVTPVTPLDPGTNIPDEEVPLANVSGLNDVDHFAYIAGYEDGTVRPTNNITRAEVATIFFRLMTEEYRVASWSTSNTFTDAGANAWYNAAISTAAKAGILKGYADGSVKPNANITRAEFAAIAARFISDDVTDDGVGDFSDTANHWAAKEIRLAAKAGWVQGDGGRFRPDDPITRAEVMIMVNRMLDRVPDADHMLPGMKTWSDNPAGTWYYAAVQEATNDHAYERAEDGATEIWTELTEAKDWAALEAEWAANNGASAPKAETSGESEAA